MSYGEIVLRRHDDSSVTVVHADEYIGVSTALLAEIDPQHIRNGMVVFDAKGEYQYLPISFADGGRTIVCRRRCDCNDWATDLRVGYPNGHHPRCPRQPDSHAAAALDRAFRRNSAGNHDSSEAQTSVGDPSSC